MPATPFCALQYFPIDQFSSDIVLARDVSGYDIVQPLTLHDMMVIYWNLKYVVGRARSAETAIGTAAAGGAINIDQEPQERISTPVTGETLQEVTGSLLATVSFGDIEPVRAYNGSTLNESNFIGYITTGYIADAEARGSTWGVDGAGARTTIDTVAVLPGSGATPITYNTPYGNIKLLKTMATTDASKYTSDISDLGFHTY